MKKMLQIASVCEWEAVFFSYDNGELSREPVFCWGFMFERPYVGRIVLRKPRLVLVGSGAI